MDKVYKFGKKRGVCSDDSGGRVVRVLVHGRVGTGFEPAHALSLP